MRSHDERTPEEIRERIERLSLIAAATVFEIVLFALDSAIPKPIPWIKIGLANIVTLALLVGAGWRLAAAVRWISGRPRASGTMPASGTSRGRASTWASST